AYSVATAVAFLRLYNGRHWLNDVLAWVGIGILSARIGCWMLPVYQRWFKWGREDSETMIISPTYNVEERGGAIAILFNF
ncbi:MAG: PAP2 family protein, partial [Muribaculaceae bacterium]|nr:PAP2 family protein [Muribaculaceae bacterium]